MIEIYIRKPLSISKGIPYVSIRYETLTKAINQGEMIRVKTDYGEAVHDPNNWVRTGKRIEKVFKFPDRPMILIANYMDIKREKRKVGLGLV